MDTTTDPNTDPTGPNPAGIEGISKTVHRCPGSRAVDLDVRAGELHVLFAERRRQVDPINVIAGTFPSDEGTFRFGGDEIRHLTPAAGAHDRH